MRKPKRSNRLAANYWEFRSRSTPEKNYTTTLWDNGKLSCNCPAWIFWKDKSKPRGCPHTRKVETLGVFVTNPDPKYSLPKIALAQLVQQSIEGLGSVVEANSDDTKPKRLITFDD